MNSLKIFLLFLTLTLITNIHGQKNISLADRILIDSGVTIGKLENGLTYYLLYNMKPEKRAFLRLVLNAGSILEVENQRGLTHFVEHMAFNGSNNFTKKLGQSINLYI